MPTRVAVGQRYGRWLVIAESSPDKRGKRFECLCDPDQGGCGVVRSVLAGSLTRGDSRSCGCLKRQSARLTATTHGLVGHELFGVWRGMLARCTNPNNGSWPRYGGRGIAVCQRWQGVFGMENFVQDMAPRPQGDYVLHRCDNDGPYSPENCEWVQRGEHLAVHGQIRRAAERRLKELEGEVHRLRLTIADGIRPSRFEDERGWIEDLDVGPIDAVTEILTAAGAVRGNHVHRESWQTTVVLEGELLMACLNGQRRREFPLRPGELAISPPGEAHAWRALSDCRCLVFTRGPRSGSGYESDTHRLPKEEWLLSA